ncbi:MAG: bifunctional DNA-formamidopyrimidine glycosylase/DNA-(apurinic or apyrimidinic site) lyase [Candidatus Saccharibacteria bacterium]|nr:bifunctional DNA-formamidopyrimidine glycosylase/DNA-(apurinic or apyrimidinic site) lyase [Candidatus Saccharibacteria bacterium]
MPELPEVETIKRGLSKFIVEKTIVKTEILCEKSFVGPVELTEGQKIVGITRRGKALLIELANGITMMIHLRMTGQLIYRGEESYAGGHPSENFVAELPNKQTRVIFEFNDGTHLYFNDQRKFGFVKLIPNSEIDDDPFIAKLAPEPWDMPLEQFTTNLNRHKNSCIKATILDQSVIAGVGNIYADEALFATKIHPERLSGSLTEPEIKNLLANIAKVMDASINSGGSTMATYVRADGTRGDYLEKFAQVFRREGEPCPCCGTEIKKIRVAGRGTHICPECQRF